MLGAKKLKAHSEKLSFYFSNGIKAPNLGDSTSANNFIKSPDYAPCAVRLRLNLIGHPLLQRPFNFHHCHHFLELTGVDQL
jgi:hypothetical protein